MLADERTTAAGRPDPRTAQSYLTDGGSAN